MLHPLGVRGEGHERAEQPSRAGRLRAGRPRAEGQRSGAGAGEPTEDGAKAARSEGGRAEIGSSWAAKSPRRAARANAIYF